MGPCGYASHESQSWVELEFPLSSRKTAWDLRGMYLEWGDGKQEQLRTSTPEVNSGKAYLRKSREGSPKLPCCLAWGH